MEYEDGVETIHTSEFVLKPHHVEGQKTLPFFIDGEDFEATELRVSVVPSAIVMYTGRD